MAITITDYLEIDNAEYLQSQGIKGEAEQTSLFDMTSQASEQDNSKKIEVVCKRGLVNTKKQSRCLNDTKFEPLLFCNSNRIEKANCFCSFNYALVKTVAEIGATSTFPVFCARVLHPAASS